MGNKSKKKNKKKKNYDSVSTKLIYSEEGQYYAVITKMLGDGRVMLKYVNGKNRLVEVMGIIRGSMRKRVWINIGNFVLITERDYESGKVDIIHKYTDKNVHSLKKNKEITQELFDCSDSYTTKEGDDKIEASIDFIQDDENEYEKEYTEDIKNSVEKNVSSTLNDIETMNKIKDDEFNWDEI